MNTLTLNKVLLNARPLNMRKRLVKDKDFYYKVLDREFSFSITAGGKRIKSSTATIKRLKGNSVVWNQRFTSFREAYANPTSEFEYVDGGVTIPLWEGYQPFRFDIGVTKLKGHKMLLMCDYHNESTTDKTIDFEFGNQKLQCLSSQFFAGFIDITATETNKYKDSLSIFVEVTQNAPITMRNIRLIDLTQMFGAGNEPTTIEEFNARKPIVEDEYAYNEGEVIHMTAEGIKSVGDNAWDEQWEKGKFNTTDGSNVVADFTMRMKNAIKVLPNATYYCKSHVDTWVLFLDKDEKVIEGYSTGLEKYQNACKAQDSPFTTPSNAAYIKAYFNQYFSSVTTYNHDIMITLVHSGWKQDTDAGYQPYWEDRLIFDQRIKDEFPNGMSKWDMVYNKNGKGYIVKGMSIIDDLSLYDWQYLDDDGRFFVDGISGLTSVDVTEKSELLCAKYVTMSALDTYLGKDGIANDNDRLWIKDNSTTEVATIKDKLHNVRLYHRLAEPTIIEYDEPFNLDYKVADFGTEQAIAEQPSAPISAEIGYHILKTNLELTLNS